MDNRFNDLADRFSRLSFDEIELLECQFCHDGAFFGPKHLTFPTRAAKHAHMEFAHSVCRPCNIYFNGEGLRQLHWETAPEHLHDYCRFHRKLVECAENQSLKEQWRKHIQDEHFPCGDPCDKVFDTENERTLHRIDEHWRRICPFCGASFKPGEALRWDVHMNRHHWCKTCVLAFSSEAERKDHYATSTKHSSTYCGICDRHYKDAASLLEHHYAMHDDRKFENGDEELEGQYRRFDRQGRDWRNSHRGQPGRSNEGGFKRRRYQDSQGSRSSQADPGWRYTTDGQPYRPRPDDHGWRFNRDRHWSESNTHGEQESRDEPDDPWRHWQEFFESEHNSPDPSGRQNQRRPHKRSETQADPPHGSPNDQRQESRSESWQRGQHPRGKKCGNENWRNDQPGNSQRTSNHRPKPPRSPPPNAKRPFPDHYATLNVPRDLPQPDMEKAAKRRRVDVHPDRLAKLTGLSAEERAAREAEAKEVGCAADVLANAEARKRYDRQLREWEAR